MSSSTESDSDLLNSGILISRAQLGNEGAWRQIYQRNRTMLVMGVKLRMPAYARRSFDEEDVLQSAFLAAWSEIDSFEYRGEGSLRRWLSRIVFNHFQDELRRRNREQKGVSLESTSFDAKAAEEQICPQDPPSQIVSNAEEKDRLYAAMRQLSTEDQDILVMRIFEKLSWSRVMEVLQCSRAVANKRFQRALDRMTHLL